MRELPVGYFDFSKDEALNFQLNRFYSSGTIEYAELMEIGQRVKGFEEWVAYFTTLGDDAQSNGNFLKAAQCYRAAQFYTLGEKKDKNGIPMKKVLYEKCRSNYDRVYRRIFKRSGFCFS